MIGYPIRDRVIEKGPALDQEQWLKRSRIPFWVGMDHQRAIARLWARDHTLWKPDPFEIANRPGWLPLPERMRGRIPDLKAFVREIREAGFKHVVLLGMEGSSLAPEVFRATFRLEEVHPRFSYIDRVDRARGVDGGSTAPAAGLIGITR
jgi:hypothetical protein